MVFIGLMFIIFGGILFIVKEWNFISGVKFSVLVFFWFISIIVVVLLFVCEELFVVIVLLMEKVGCNVVKMFVVVCG